MKRRGFLLALFGMIAVAVLGRNSNKLRVQKPEDWIETQLRAKLSYLDMESEAVNTFVEELKKQNPSGLYTRIVERKKEYEEILSDDVCSLFLLSTDLFTSPSAIPNYVALYSPYSRPCANPFFYELTVD